MSKKEVKTGVNRGGGPPPGYAWSVRFLVLADKEIGKTFVKAAYEHLKMQVRQLASETKPSHSKTVSVKPVEDFFEIRDKGGVLNSVNARVFFGIDSENQAIVILGGIKKQNDGKTRKATKFA